MGVPQRDAVWSPNVSEADWIAESFEHPLPSPAEFVVGGLAAYAQILHPAEEEGLGSRTVRWSEVAAWSGLPLRSESGFESIALPQIRPSSPRPWSGQGPDEGRLYRPYVEALTSILRHGTTTPDSCWFCVWEGYGDPDLVPPEANTGPRVHLPDRSYLLFHGPVDVALGSPFDGRPNQSPNIWWPTDRTWFVATEIDFPWTYVGGSEELIERILTDEHIEAIPAEVPAQYRHVGWIHDLAVNAANQLETEGHVLVDTAAGTVEAWLRGRELRTKSLSESGVASTSHTPRVEPDHLVWRIEYEIISLV